MAEKKAGLPWLIALLALCLCGCGAMPLAQRDMVRGVCFSREGARTQTILLTADLTQKDDPEALGACLGEGDTPQKAFSDAIQKLKKEPFWGLLDTLLLPEECSYEEMEQCVALVTDVARPSTEIDLYLVQKRETLTAPETYAISRYQEARQTEEKFALRCGVERCFARPAVAVLYTVTQNSYAATLLQEEGDPLRYSGPVTAQLAALLCGDTETMMFSFWAGAAQFKADAGLRFAQNKGEALAAVLQLQNVSWQTPTELSQTQAENEVRALLLRVWNELFEEEVPTLQAFGVTFWQKTLGVAQQTPQKPALTVKFSPE